MTAFYELRYWKNFEQPDGSIVRLEIHSKGIEGVSRTTYEIGPVVQALALSIQGQTDDIDAPIVKTSLNMTFVDAPDHPMSFLQKCGDWEEFYTNDSTYWKVLILGKKNAAASSFTQLWGGYITPDSFSEELTYRGNVTLTARDNIGHMQDFPFDAEGDENGLISLRELVEAAWAKIESPMSLYWPALRWLQCNGVYAFDTRMNVSAFKDMTWYDAVEKALYSYGAVMRYIGENQVLLCSLRYMPQQARPSIDQVAHIEPVFVANAQRQLVPAARRIEESVEYELENSIPMPQVKEDDFTGATQTYRCKIDGIDMGNGSFGTLEHDAPVWPIQTAFAGWISPTTNTLYFNPDAYEIGYFSERKGLAEDMYRYMYLACNNVDSRSVAFAKTITCSDISIRMKFGQPVSLDKNNRLEQQAVFNLKKITYSIKMIQDGITNYLAKDNRWVVGEQILVKEYDAKTQNFDFEQQVSMDEYSGSAEIVFTIYSIEYAQTSLANLAQYGLYACVQSLAFVVPESLSVLKKNTVNTKYQDSNNVILSREPELGPAYNTVALPGIIKNGIFYYEGNVVQPANSWSWNDGTPQQMAVYNHLQLLCYHSKPNNLITGDIVNADVIKTTAIYVWGGAEHMLISGTYNYLTGYVEGAVLREFVRYDDMWGEISGNSLPDTEENSTTNQEGGGSTSPGSTNENTTNVVIGGEGGGSVTIDPFLSDTSSNPVESKAIKAYIDSADNEIKERIAALEEGGGSVDITVDTAMSDTSENAVANKVIKKYVDGKAEQANEYTDEEVAHLEGVLEGEIAKKQDVLVSGMNIKTINGQSILGSGNITIQGGGGATERVEMTAESASIEPNKFYVWGDAARLNLTLAEGKASEMNRYMFQFKTSKTAYTILQLPEDIVWSTDTEMDENDMPVIELSAYHRVEIVDGLATLRRWRIVAKFIEFEDKEFERVLILNGIGTSEGVSKKQAASLTSIPEGWFANDGALTSLNDLSKFPNLTDLAARAFMGCGNLKTADLSLIETTDGSIFAGCPLEIPILRTPALKRLAQNVFPDAYIEEWSDMGQITELPDENYGHYGRKDYTKKINLPTAVKKLPLRTMINYTALEELNTENIEEYGPASLAYTSSLKPISFASAKVLRAECLRGSGMVADPFIAPNLEQLEENALYEAKIKRISDLGKITFAPRGGTFYESYGARSDLIGIVFPASVTTIDVYTLYEYTKLQYIMFLSDVPPTAANDEPFYNTNNCPIYVPDASVEAYKNAMNWQRYIGRIKGISEYTGTL